MVSLQSVVASQSSWKQAWTGGQARKEGEYWGQLEPQGGLELIWSYMQHIFLSLFFFLSSKLGFLVTGILVEKTFSSPPPCPEHTGRQWVVIIPCFYFVSQGDKMTICCIAYKDCSTQAEFLKELVFNKTVFGCLSPFKIVNHISLETSDWAVFHKILLKTSRFNLVLTK